MKREKIKSKTALVSAASILSMLSFILEIAALRHHTVLVIK